MTRIAGNLGLSLALLFAGALTPAHGQSKPEVVDLFAPLEPSAATKRSGRPAAPPQIPGMRPETVGAVSYFSLSPAGTRGVRSARSAAAPQGFRITLPDATTVVCNVKPERRAGGVVAMQGAVDGDSAFDRCNLYEEDGRISGDIDVAAGRFAIVPVGDMHAVVQVKTQAFPNESEPLSAPEPPTDGKRGLARDAATPLPVCDVPPQAGQPVKVLGPLRVMVVYTPATRTGFNMTTAIERLRDQLKEAFIPKGGNFSVTTELVHAEEVAYSEPKYTDSEKAAYSEKAGFKMERDMDIDLWRLTDKQDPIFKRIHELRDRHKAHIVHLITMRDPNQNGCGLGWIVPNLAQLGVRGFSTSGRQCALQNFSFVHEIGHNIGMSHDRGVVNNPRPGAFNFGYVLTSRCMRSVMAYDKTCREACAQQPGGCRRFNVFSSPLLRLQDGTPFGKPMGDPQAAYNMEILCRAGTALKGMP